MKTRITDKRRDLQGQRSMLLGFEDLGYFSLGRRVDLPIDCMQRHTRTAILTEATVE